MTERPEVTVGERIRLRISVGESMICYKHLVNLTEEDQRKFVRTALELMSYLVEGGYRDTLPKSIEPAIEERPRRIRSPKPSSVNKSASDIGEDKDELLAMFATSFQKTSR